MIARNESSTQITRLPNGIRVVTETLPWARSVATGFRFGVGARDESDEVAGASHFLEHLLFKGTEGRTATEIAEAIESVGGEMNAHTGREDTAYYTRLPAAHVDLGLDVLSEVVLAPAFRPNEVEAERQVILEEIAMDEDRAFTLLADALWPGHPLGREVAGTRQSIEAMTREDIAGFHDRWYTPANLVVSAAGPIEHGDVVDVVAKRFAAVDGGDRPVRVAPTAALKPLAVQRRRSEQVHVAMAMRGVSRHDEDRYALDVADQVLGGGTTSRLFQSIREQRGLAYSVYSSAAELEDTGELAVYAGTAPGRFAAVLRLLVEELERFAIEGPTDAELATAKGYLEGALLLGTESVAGTMSAIGRAVLHHDHVLTPDEVVARYRAVTADDIRRVLERVVVGAPRAVAVVGPVTKRDVAALLA